MKFTFLFFASKLKREKEVSMLWFSRKLNVGKPIYIFNVNLLSNHRLKTWGIFYGIGQAYSFIDVSCYLCLMILE